MGQCDRDGGPDLDLHVGWHPPEMIAGKDRLHPGRHEARVPLPVRAGDHGARRYRIGGRGAAFRGDGQSHRKSLCAER